MLNQTRVFPARLYDDPLRAVKSNDIIRQQDDGNWLALGKPGKCSGGRKIDMVSGKFSAVVKIEPSEDGLFCSLIVRTLHLYFETEGVLPLPPYINRGLMQRGLRYQTVFAKTTGAIAATAGTFYA